MAPLRGVLGIGSAIMGAIYMKYSDWITLTYLVLDEWRDGFPIGVAIKDATYAMCNNNFGSLAALNLPVSATQREVSEDDDPVTSICTLSMYTLVTEVPALADLLDSADAGTTAERADAYLQACREVYGAMEPGGRHRAVLDSLPMAPGKPSGRVGLTNPVLHGPLSDQDYLTHRVIRDAIASQKPDLEPQHQNLAEAEPAWVRPSLEANLGVKPITPEIVPASEVAEALYHGRVVQFDATEFLPRGIWNLTIPEIARMHGDLADEIPIYKQKGTSGLFGWSSLREVGRRIELLEKANKLYHPDSVPVPRDPNARPGRGNASVSAPIQVDGKMAKKVYGGTVQASLQKLYSSLPESRDIGLDKLLGDVADLAQMSVEETENMLHYFRIALAQWTINVRRLPKIPEIDLKKAMGDPWWVERSWSMFWTGAMASWWHNDEPDNMLICVNKEITVAVFMMNDTDAISGLRGPIGEAVKYFDLNEFHPDKVSPEWFEKNQWIKKFPYIRVHLKPGMGVTVPSRAYHTIWAQDSDRILLNSFLVPKYGALTNAPRSKSSYFAEGTQSKEYMALWHLKMSSIGRLWDQRHLGGFFEYTKLEIM